MELVELSTCTGQLTINDVLPFARISIGKEGVALEKLTPEGWSGKYLRIWSRQTGITSNLALQIHAESHYLRYGYHVL